MIRKTQFKALLALFLIPILFSCQVSKPNEPDTNDNIPPSATHPAPAPYDRLTYEEYFSIERSMEYELGTLDGWAILVDSEATYRVPVTLLPNEGASYDDEKRIDIGEPVKQLEFLPDAYLYCLSYGGEVYRMDQYGNYKESLIRMDAPIDTAAFDINIIYFTAGNTVYRYHIESGTIDTGCGFSNEIHSLNPSTNYIVEIRAFNPSYEDYLAETGDDSGYRKFIITRYDFHLDKIISESFGG